MIRLLYNLESDHPDKCSTQLTPYPMLYFISPWLFCNFQFVLLNPFPLFTHSPNPLPYGNHPMFSVSLSLFLFCLFIFFRFFILSEIMWYMSFSVWLSSFSLVPCRSIHVVANGKISFFYGWFIFTLHCIYASLLIYPFTFWWTLRLFPYLGYYK